MAAVKFNILFIIPFQLVPFFSVSFCLLPWDIAPALHLSTSILVCFVYFPGTLLQLYICPLPSLCVLFISLGHCSSSTSVHFHPCVFCLFPWDIAPALHLSTSILVCFVYFPGTLLQLYICPLPSLCVLFISLGHCSSSTSVHFHPCVFCLFPWDIAPALHLSTSILVCFVYFPGTLLQLYICPLPSLCVLFISLGHCSSSTSVHFHPCVFCLFPWDIAPALHLSTSILVCFHIKQLVAFRFVITPKLPPFLIPLVSVYIASTEKVDQVENKMKRFFEFYIKKKKQKEKNNNKTKRF